MIESHRSTIRGQERAVSVQALFSNCVGLPQLPRHMQELARAQGRSAEYSPAQLRGAAEAFFHIEEHGHLGRRPLWRLVAR